MYLIDYIQGVFVGKSGSICCFVAALLLLTIIQTESLNAQIAPGDRVRLDVDTVKSEKIFFFFSFKTPERTKVIGQLIDMNDTSIYIADQSFPSEVRQFRLEEVHSIYKSIGKKRATLNGIIYGGGFCVLSILIFSMGPIDPPYNEETGESNRPNVLKASATFGGIGAIVGGIFGWLTHIDKWQKVDKDELKTKINIGLLDNRKGIGLSLRF